MDSTSPSVVLYRYEASPYARKISNILLHKGIPYHEVDVSRILPRPELSELLGVGYRRIPVLAIGNDVFCDTPLIARALEIAFPASAGYGTLYPELKGAPGKTPGEASMEAFSTVFISRVFGAAVGTLPWDKFDAEFLKDRSAMLGRPIDPQTMIPGQSVAVSTLGAHLSLLQDQLADGREWMFDTVTPSLADLSAHFLLDWVKLFPVVTQNKLFDEQKYPSLLAWLSRVTKHLADLKANGKGVPTKVSGDKAAELVLSRNLPQSTLARPQINEVELGRLNLQAGGRVVVAPEDTGKKPPTVGKLIGLNMREIVVETQGTSGKTACCHFPRLGFTVVPEQEGMVEKVANIIGSKI